MNLLEKILTTGPGSIYLPEPTQNRPAPEKTKAGRNLKAAVIVGVSIGAITIALLLLPKVYFLGMIIAVALLAQYELAAALARVKIRLCLLPLWIGTIGIEICAYLIGAEATWAAFLITLVSLAVWRLLGGADAYAIRDVLASTMVALYIPLMAAFIVLMLAHDSHPFPIVMWVLVTISNDIGGYAAGVWKGKHPLAPSVSPAKSWEGFIGSVLARSLVALACLYYGGISLWLAPVFGISTAVMATLGDLGESLIKRDLGLKDMGHTLPGHGGIMDRLDSLLITVPIFFIATQTCL